MINKKVRKNILDHINMENINYSGRMSDLDFLNRIYELKEMESLDARFSDASEDICQHTVNNHDYEENWVFEDPRFNLTGCSEDDFLKFLCEMIHPLVRQDKEEVGKIYQFVNDWLSDTGWEIYPTQKRGEGNEYSYRRKGSMKESKSIEHEDLSAIWRTGRVKIFISHRDIHKKGAKELGQYLEGNGISCFVAHDSIEPMSIWKNEILKALKSMEALICYITKDFYESLWTNQEIGFALARGIPIYLFSSDNTDPKGFLLDIQAIKAGRDDLLRYIKSDFSNNVNFKITFLNAFIEAKDGSFINAKNKFVNLIDFDLDDKDIEMIVEAFGAEAKFINQLSAVLSNPIQEDHKDHPLLKYFEYYRDYLNEKLFTKHSAKKFRVREVATFTYKVIEE